MSLALDQLGQLTEISSLNTNTLTSSLDNLAAAGVDQISIEGLAVSGVSATGNLADLTTLESAISASNTNAIGLPNALSLEISDAQANALADLGAPLTGLGGFSFANDNADVILDSAGATHLSTSLKDLQKLNIDAVQFTNQLGAEILTGDVGLDLGSGFGLSEIIAKPGLFNPDLNVTLNSNFGDDLLPNAASAQSLIDTLVSTGIDNLALQETLSSSVDWFDFDKTRALHALTSNDQQIGFEIGVAGSTGAAASANFDASLKKALADDFTSGIDFFKGVTTSTSYGQLIEALMQSGVTDFVVESGNVAISDSLASAMVESGMLQALPAANLIIDATAKTMEIAGAKIAHLYTDLKSMAGLDVDGIRVANDVSKVYIDLGLPMNDVNAIADVKALLASLDPANDAKLIGAAPNTPIDFNFAKHENGSSVDLSLVISSDLAKTLLESLGSSDIAHLSHLGIKEFAVLDNTIAGNLSANTIIPIPAPPSLPEVKIIGPNTNLFDELDPNKPHP